MRYKETFEGSLMTTFVLSLPTPGIAPDVNCFVGAHVCGPTERDNLEDGKHVLFFNSS